MIRRPLVLRVAMLTLLGVVLGGCGRSGVNSTVIDFALGDKAANPPLTYSVIETSWKTQLGEGFKIRSPQNRFLLVRVSVTNGGGAEVALPLFSLIDVNGKEYREEENGEGVDNWFGLLRSVAPAQTLQGQLLFDVPLASYKIRLPNGGAIGEEKFITVNIPLRLDGDQSVQSPSIGVGVAK
jgi:hypothetical protein